jgi:hypothetical protein
MLLLNQREEPDMSHETPGSVLAQIIARRIAGAPKEELLQLEAQFEQVVASQHGSISDMTLTVRPATIQ